MSLVYKCDGCSTAISQDEIQRGEALAHEGQHYCSRCKVPILAFLKNAGGAPAAGNAPGGAPVEPPPAPPPPGEEVEADPLDLLEGLPAVPPESPPAKAPPPVSRPAAPARPPGPGKVPRPGLAASGKPAPATPAAKPHAALPPGAKARGVKPPGAARPPAAAAGQRAAPGAGSPAKAPAGKIPPGRIPTGRIPAGKPLSAGPPRAPIAGTPGPRKAGAAPAGLGLRRAAGKTPPGAPGGVLKAAAGRRSSRFAARRPGAAEEGAEPQARKLPPPPVLAAIAGGAVLLLALIGGAIYYYSNGDSSPSSGSPAAVSTPGASTATPGAATSIPGAAPLTPAAAETAEIDKQRQYLATLRGKLSNEPEKLFELERDLLLMGRPREAVAEEYQLLAREIEGRKMEVGRNLLEETRSRSETLQKDLQFLQAHELWKTIPRLVEQNSDLYRQWVEGEQLASQYAEKARSWAHLVEKATRYVAQGDRDIALAILEENVPSKYEHEFPLLWDDCQKLLNKIRTEGAEAIARASEIERKAREAREAELRAIREKEREERWNHALELIDWVPLLSLGGDLENWYKTIEFNPMDLGSDPFPWKNTREGDQQVLSADNSGRDGEIMIGMNGDRWQDWALEFEVQVIEGSLRLETRTVLGMRGRGGLKAPEDFTFESKDYGSWTRVRLEVRARKVRWIEGGTVKKEIETDHEDGGFKFNLLPKSICKLRDIRIKLISVLKPGDEPGASRFGEEEEDE